MRTLLKVALLLVLILPFAAQAQFTFTTNADNTLAITGYTGTNDNIVIPETINGRPVASIDGYFPYWVTNITIPRSVTNITPGVFAFKSFLTAITVDGLNAYYSSSNGILFDKFQTLLVQAPAGISGSYMIPTSVTNIANSALEGCNLLTNITIGTNVVSIGDYAFASCAGLANVLIPDSVSSIGNYSFYSCGSLGSVLIPKNVTQIGSSAFAYCVGLSNIVVDGQNIFYSSSSGVLFDKPQHTLIQAPASFLGSFSIPTSVTSVGAGAFQNCAYLTDINIPDNVTNIGDSAFAGCGNLVAITVSGQNLFYSSTNGILFNKLQTTLLQFPAAQETFCKLVEHLN